MKKLIAIILILALLVPAVSSADLSVLSCYSLFIDAEAYNSFFNAGWDYDSMWVSVVIMSDGKTAYYQKEEWTDGERITTGLTKCAYSVNSGKFTLSFSNGEVLSGYYDENDEDMWLNLGGAYFRLCPVHYFYITKDFKVAGE